MASVIVDKLIMRIEFDCGPVLASIDRATEAFDEFADALAVKRPHCCVIDCPQDAVVRITDTRPEIPYDVAETHACADHVRELGGEDPHAHVERFDAAVE